MPGEAVSRAGQPRGRADNWSHYYDSDDSVSRLDYILTDKKLKATEREILRMGLTLKCEKYTGPRYPTVGLLNTEASDHCAVTAVLDV